jgi:hypothetical protein
MEDDFIIASKTIVLIPVHTNTYLFAFTHTFSPTLFNHCRASPLKSVRTSL